MGLDAGAAELRVMSLERGKEDDWQDKHKEKSHTKTNLT